MYILQRILVHNLLAQPMFIVYKKWESMRSKIKDKVKIRFKLISMQKLVYFENSITAYAQL